MLSSFNIFFSDVSTTKIGSATCVVDFPVILLINDANVSLYKNKRNNIIISTITLNIILITLLVSNN